MLGTPRYMAPEQFSDGPVDRRADFYGFACIAFEALSGRPVITSSNVFDIIREQAQFTLPPREEIGRGISPEMHEVLLQRPGAIARRTELSISTSSPPGLRRLIWTSRGSDRGLSTCKAARFLLGPRAFLPAAPPAPGESTNFLASAGV